MAHCFSVAKAFVVSCGFKSMPDGVPEVEYAPGTSVSSRWIFSLVLIDDSGFERAVRFDQTSKCWCRGSGGWRLEFFEKVHCAIKKITTTNRAVLYCLTPTGDEFTCRKSL